MGKHKLDFREKTPLNLLMNIVRTITMSLIGIFMAPYYLDILGISTYAIIPLATTMAAYIQVVSDSLAYSTVRYNILAFNTNNEEEYNKTFSSSFFGLGKGCIALVPIVIVLAIMSPAIFQIGENAAHEVQLLFLMILGSSLIVTHSVTFNGVFYSKNDLYILYFAKFAYSIAQVSVIILLFTTGTPSLVDIGIGYLLSSFVVYFIQIFYAKRLFPGLKIKRKYYDKQLFKEIGTLGFWSVLSKIGNLLFIEITLVLVNIYLGSEEEGGFALVATTISMINTACYTITSSIDPYIYKYYSEKKEKELSQVTYTGTKLTTIMIAFPTLFLLVFSEEFFGTWLGSEYTYLSHLMVIGFMGNLAFCAVATVNELPKIYLRVKPQVAVTLLFGVINTVTLVLMLPSEHGNTELAMTIWTICTIAVSVYLSVFCAQLTHTKWYRYLWATFMGYIIIAVLYYPLDILKEALDLPYGWIPLIATALLTYVIYLVGAYILLFTSKEKSMLNGMFPAAISKHLPKISIR